MCGDEWCEWGVRLRVYVRGLGGGAHVDVVAVGGGARAGRAARARRAALGGRHLPHDEVAARGALGQRAVPARRPVLRRHHALLHLRVRCEHDNEQSLLTNYEPLSTQSSNCKYIAITSGYKKSIIFGAPFVMTLT